MSAEPYDADPGALPQAQAAVDILPVQPGRKTREPEPVQSTPAVDPGWAQATAAVNPWTGAPEQAAAFAEQPGPDQVAPEQPAAPTVEQAAAPAPVEQPHGGATPLVYAGAIPPPVSVPVFPGASVPAAEPAGEDAATPGAKRFLGMQLRRPRKADGTPGDEQEPQPEAAPSPVAAWPTDVGVGVVAHAEPASPAPWGPPVGYAAPDEYGTAEPDAVPVQAVEPLPEALAEPVAEPVFVEPVATAPVPVAVETVAVQPVALEPVALEPVPVATPVPAPPAHDEVRAMRTLVDASEAQRTAAEQRADNAVAYAQQLQAELTRVQSELEGKLQASEIRTRTAANEAQDWQIRHREAQTQITELAASLAGAEQRLADVRAERDELMTQLEDATNPDREAVAEQLES